MKKALGTVGACALLFAATLVIFGTGPASGTVYEFGKNQEAPPGTPIPLLEIPAQGDCTVTVNIDNNDSVRSGTDVQVWTGGVLVWALHDVESVAGKSLTESRSVSTAGSLSLVGIAGASDAQLNGISIHGTVTVDCQPAATTTLPPTTQPSSPPTTSTTTPEPSAPPSAASVAHPSSEVGIRTTG